MNINKLFIFFVTMLTFNIHAEESSKIFTSYESQYEASIVISPSEKSNFYYIKFNGFEHHYDDSVLLYHKVERSQGYVYQLAGMPNINVRNSEKRALINGTLVPYQEVFLDNNSVTRVIYSGSADIVQERNIKQQYLDRQLVAISKVTAKKMIKSAHKEFSKSCNSTLTLDINWSDFSKKGDKTVPSKLVAYLNALKKICNIDKDYSDAVQTILTIKVTPSDNETQHKATLDGHVLTLNIGKEVPNIIETSYALLYEIF